MRSLAMTAALLLCACADEEWVVERGVLDDGEGLGISVPGRAFVGEPFFVTVATWGGCIYAESTDVTYVDDDTARVEPYDRRGVGCNVLKLCIARHEAELTFDTPGTKVIVFRGRTKIYQRPPEHGTIYQLIDVPTMVVVE